MHGADLYSLVLNITGLQCVGLENEVAFNGPAWYISVLFLCYFIFFFLCKRNYFGIYILLFLIIYRCNISVPFMTQHVSRGLLGFSVGGICFYIWSNVSGRYIRNITGAVILFTSVLWMLFRRKNIDIFGDKFLYFILIFWPSFFLFCIVSEKLSGILSNKLFVWLGSISYSLFLWHFPIEVCFVLYGHMTNRTIDFHKPEIWMIRMVLSMMIAAGSFYFIEPALDKLADRLWKSNASF